MMFGFRKDPPDAVIAIAERSTTSWTKEDAVVLRDYFAEFDDDDHAAADLYARAVRRLNRVRANGRTSRPKVRAPVGPTLPELREVARSAWAQFSGARASLRDFDLGHGDLDQAADAADFALRNAAGRNAAAAASAHTEAIAGIEAARKTRAVLVSQLRAAEQLARFAVIKLGLLAEWVAQRRVAIAARAHKLAARTENGEPRHIDGGRDWAESLNRRDQAALAARLGPEAESWPPMSGRGTVVRVLSPGDYPAERSVADEATLERLEVSEAHPYSLDLWGRWQVVTDKDSPPASKDVAWRVPSSDRRLSVPLSGIE
jgi:hypothetical protein